MILVLAAELAIFTVLSPSFMQVNNMRNVLVQSVFILLLACGMTLVLITGAIDLSVGATLGLSAGVTMYVLITTQHVGLAILSGVVSGLAIGVINGFMVAKVGLNSFIATLATLAIAEGGLRLLDDLRPLRVTEAKVEGGWFDFIGDGRVWGIPVPVLIGLAVVIILQFVLRETSFGRSVYSIGINREAAHLSGFRVVWTRSMVFVLSGLIAGLAGVILASRLGSAQAGLGLGYELDAIAAAVIGGTSLAGGRGDMIGALLGALVLGVLSNGLQLAGVDPAWFQVVLGASIIGAMLANEWLAKAALGISMRAAPELEQAREVDTAYIRGFLALEGTTVPDLLDARLRLESRAAALAAERITEEEAQTLRDLLSRMADETASDEEYARLDQMLHQTIVAASKDTELQSEYRTATEQLFITYSTRVLKLPARRLLAMSGHARLVEAITSQNSAAAERAMREHLDEVRDQLDAYLDTGRESAEGGTVMAAESGR